MENTDKRAVEPSSVPPPPAPPSDATRQAGAPSGQQAGPKPSERQPGARGGSLRPGWQTSRSSGPRTGQAGAQRPGGQAWSGGAQPGQLVEKLISINRVAKVHKGGKRLAFNALAVVGDGQGRVGVALGRANEASDAIRKGFAKSHQHMLTISLKGSTIPYEVVGVCDASKVLLKPASPGTGIIAGGPVRAVCEACGIRDILTKSLGSSNPVNLAKATLNGLMMLQPPDVIRQRRKLSIEVSEGEAG